MRLILKKIYTVTPFLVVLFFFQNCSFIEQENTSQHTAYQGISNIQK